MISVQIDSTTGSEIVPTSEFKSYARIETSDDDTLIAEIIKAAREKCEAFINRDIVAKTRSLFISNLSPSGEYGDLYRKKAKIVLPFAPITAITSVQTQASDGTLTAISYDAFGLEDKYIEVSSAYSKNIKIVYTTSGLSFEDIKKCLKNTTESRRLKWLEEIKEKYLNVTKPIEHYEELFNKKLKKIIED